ncbi:hypothetical protein SSP531S_08440 [Streptomyces spongiicola]|uniref:Uncharacterized protein n=1 Tax=Streptomyces spongiicola TaxID=1690221 RepID=A0A388SUM3_9ACTN|nr:hypothetical protein SSP531S_08440 [Streptomyces spongiicola]
MALQCVTAPDRPRRAGVGTLRGARASGLFAHRHTVILPKDGRAHSARRPPASAGPCGRRQGARPVLGEEGRRQQTGA